MSAAESRTATDPGTVTFGELFSDLARTHEHLMALAFAIANGLPSGIRASATRGISVGVTADEIQHVALLSLTHVGYSRMMQALALTNEVSNREALRCSSTGCRLGQG